MAAIILYGLRAACLYGESKENKDRKKETRKIK